MSQESSIKRFSLSLQPTWTSLDPTLSAENSNCKVFTQQGDYDEHIACDTWLMCCAFHSIKAYVSQGSALLMSLQAQLD